MLLLPLACGVEGTYWDTELEGERETTAGTRYVVDEFDGNWSARWSGYKGDTASTTGYQGRGLRTRITAGGHYGASMTRYLSPQPDEVYFRYYLKFGSNWKPTDMMTGKIPGVADLNGTNRCKGGKPPTSAAQCWSSRMMWRYLGGGKTNVGFYSYHFGQSGIYGDGDPLQAEGYTPLARNRWYCIEGHVRMNDPAQANGVLEGWVNGRPALTRRNLRYRTRANLHVERLWYDIYYGAKPTAPTNMDLYVDRLVLASRRVGCDSKPNDPMWVPGAENQPFKDMPPGSFAHDEAIKLKSAGITQGCQGGANPMYCPRATVTRSQMAAFLSRALGLPAAKADHFSDDAGSTFEDDHNRLYEAGITHGCSATAYCGSQPVTRGQMAAFLARAFKLPRTNKDYFTDDNHSIFDNDINALAAAGITKGCGPSSYCPDHQLTRAQMAIFLVRALGL